jgi:branched-chain amino acid transport system substrate-binding protein
VHINVGAATADLTGKVCAPSIVHWAYDTYMLAKSTGGATVKAGGDSWYFITADYAFGQQLQRDTTSFVTAAGGKVLGSAPYPFPGTTDFSSFLLQAQGSGAKVLGLCNAGGDTVNSIKQAKEFGLTMNLAAMLMFITDVNALGLDVAQGLHLTESFYWDLNDKTRAFTNRVKPKTPNNWPNMIHAGCYASTLHFMKAINKIGPTAAKAAGSNIVDAMKSIPTEDDCFGSAMIRQDGLAMLSAYLFEVKKPSESKGKWDYYKIAQTTPPDQAWRPLAEGGCYFVKS